MLAAGLPHKEIAARTLLSPSTVGNRLAGIRHKLGAASNLDLVFYWIRQNAA